jgi:hypothetical protein
MKKLFSFIILILLAPAIGCMGRLVFSPDSPLSYLDIETIPYVLSIDPGEGAIDVPTSTPVTTEFSQDIDPATVDISSFVVADSDYVPVDGTYSFSPDNRTVTFTPANALVHLAEYNVLLTTDITGMKGARLSSEKLWYFITISSGTVSDPVFTPVPGTYEGPQMVAISCLDPETSMRFTTDGTEPSPSNGSGYTAPFMVGANTLYPVKAIAYRSGFTDSSVSSACYTIQAFTPVMDPPPGIYNLNPMVTLTTQTPGATMRYTLDLSDPATSVTAFTYIEPFGVSGPGAVMIMAVTLSPDPLLIADSPVLTAGYIINYEQVAPPVFSPQAGTYTADFTVTLSSSTQGSKIVYTADGSDPHAGGIAGGNPATVPVSDSSTITAYAYDDAGLLADSAVMTGTYIMAPTIVSMMPDKGPNYAPACVTITGTHFKTGITARLTRNVLPSIVATGITLISDNIITCAFDITGQSKGKWTLVVTNPDSGTALKNEFRIY